MRLLTNNIKEEKQIKHQEGESPKKLMVNHSKALRLPQS